MPNWCECELRIIGDRDMLESLRANARGDMPLFSEATSHKSAAPTDHQHHRPTCQAVCPSGASRPFCWSEETWLHPDREYWRVEEMRVRIEPWLADASRLIATFYSAGWAPTERLLRISALWPELVFECVWRECGWARAGLWIARGGRVAADTEGAYAAGIEWGVEEN